MPALTRDQRTALASHAAALRAVSARRPDREADAVQRLLDARRFHQRAVRALAKPERFAKAVRCLERATGSDGLAGILWSRVSDQIKLNRLAVAFGLVEPCSGAPALIAEELRKRTDEGARLALAAHGVGINWAGETRRVRAAYALSRLFAAFRERAP